MKLDQWRDEYSQHLERADRIRREREREFQLFLMHRNANQAGLGLAPVAKSQAYKEDTKALTARRARTMLTLMSPLT